MLNLSSGSSYKYAIFGGTFDPVHNGHLLIALHVLEAIDVNKLYVVPAFLPPLKTDRRITNFKTRLRWLELAFEGIDCIEVSPIESQFEGVSYTLLTVQHFSRIHNRKPHLILGADSLTTLERWYKYRELLDSVITTVYPRPGVDISSELDRLNIAGDIIILSDVPLVEISSSTIRNRSHERLPVNGFVPCSITKEVYNHYR